MELRYLLQVIRGNRRLLAGAAILAGLLALAATYVLPETFEASTTVLIRPRKGPAGDQTSKSMMDYPVSFNIPVDTMSKTYAQIMDSDAVASRVVDILHLDTAKPPRDPRWWKRAVQVSRDRAKLVMVRGWEFLRYGRLEPKDPYREAVDNVVRGLHANPIPDTFLFSLTASARDAQLSARIANTAANVFMDYTRATRIDEEGTGAKDIHQRLATVNSELDEGRRQLQAFGDGTTSASLDRELQLRIESLAKFESEREGVISELGGLEAETKTLQTQLASEREATQSSTTVARNPVIAEIETSLAKNQVEYAGLSKTLAPDHPRILELKAQIDEANRRLAAASPQVPDRDTSALNVTRLQIQQKMLDRQAQRDSDHGHLAALNQSIKEYTSEVDSLTRQKADLSRLSLNVEVLENEYRLLSQEEAEASLAALQEIGEIRTLSAAVPPVYPVRPVKVDYAIAGVVLGFLIALISALTRDYAEPRVRGVDGLQATFGVPLLAVVPHTAARLEPAPFLLSHPSRTLGANGTDFQSKDLS